MRPGRAVAGGLAALGGVLLLGVGGVPVTTAGFTDAAALTGDGFSSGSMSAPAIPDVEQVPGSGATRVRWTAPALGQHGGAPSAYEVLRYPAASGGSAVVACSLEVGSSTDVGQGLECDDTSRTPGSHHYAVVARQGTRWRAESPRREITPELSGPSVAVTDPAEGYRGSGFLLRLGLLFSCGGAPACGSAADPSGVAAVRWSLAFRPAGSDRTRCWNGTAYVAPTGTGCVEGGADIDPVRGGVRWRLPGTSDGPLRDRGSYVLTVSAIDSFASTTSVDVRFVVS